MPRLNPNTPYGLRPIQRNDGAVWRDSLRRYLIPAAQTNAIFIGDPGLKLAASADAQGYPAIGLAAAGGRITGVVCGFDPMFATSGSPGPMFRPAATTLPYYALVNDDPEALFEVQVNDPTGTFTVASVGKNANLIAGAGSPFTGWSGWMLDPTTIATTATLQVSIVSVLPEIADNTPGQPWLKVCVRLNNPTEIAGQAGI